MSIVPADPTTLFEQAYKTADDYMRQGRRAIDREFGDGYAAKHPELVAAFMHTAATDFNTGMVAKATGEAAEQLSGSIERLASAIDNHG